MTTAKYKIVEFNDHSMSVKISRYWLNNHDQNCYWPPYKGQLKVDKAVIDMEHPDKKKWENYIVIKVRGQASNYEEALTTLKILVDSSDILKDSSAYKSTRRQRAKKRGNDSTDSENDSPTKPWKQFKKTKDGSSKKSKNRSSTSGTDEDTHPEIETPPPFNIKSKQTNENEKESSTLIRSDSKIQEDITNGNDSGSSSPVLQSPTNTAGSQSETPKGRKNNEKENDSVGNIGDLTIGEQTQESDGNKTPEKLRVLSRSSRVLTRDEEIEKRYNKSIAQIKTKGGEDERALQTAYFKEIIYLLSKQSTEIDEIKRQRYDSSQKSRSGKTKNFNWPTVLSFRDAKTFEAYITKIEKDPEMEESLIELLKCLGGRDDRIKTNTIMEKMMTDSLGSKYSWKGQKGKDKLQDLKIAKIILGTVLEVTSEVYTETEARSQIGSWLAGRKAKLNREKDKEQN